MADYAPRARLLGVLFAAVVVLCAMPAAAQDTDRLTAHATEVFNDAVDAGKGARYESACRGFGNAAVLYENAINSLFSQSMATVEDRDYIKRYADQLQANANDAKKAAKAACYLRDNPAPPGEDSSSAQSYNDLDSQKKALQSSATQAKSQYQEADRLYDAGDHAGACASARRSADTFAKVTEAMKANRGLESAFANPDQLYANAEQVAKDRDSYFCKA